MSQADTVVLLAYLVGVLAVGSVFAARNKTTADMFAAGRQSPWWVAGLSSFMTMFSAGTFVVWGGIAYKYGLVAVVINACYGVAALLVGWSVAGRWNKLGIKTPAEFVKVRFGSPALHFYTVAIMVYKLISSAVALYSLCVLLVAILRPEASELLAAQDAGFISLSTMIVCLGGLIVLYTMIGGLWGVLMTDVLQFVVLNIAVLFVVPLALADVGGFSTFVSTAPEGFFAPTAGDFTWLFLVGWVGIHYFILGAEWAFVQRYLCVPTPSDARKSSFLFGFLYLASPLLWLLPPMIQRIRVPLPNNATPETINAFAESAYIDACLAILPSGMVGLMVAAMFSATASMISSQLNVFAGVFTNDIIRPRLRTSASEGTLVWIGRFSTMCFGGLIIILATMVPRLGGAETVIISATSLMVGPLLVPLLLGLLSSKVPTSCVWLTAATSWVLVLLIKIGQHDLTMSSFIPGAQWLIQWVSSIGRLSDLLVGLVLPILIAGMCHLAAKGIAPGWDRLQSLQVATNQLSKRASDSPTKIVAWSLIACGVLMACISIWSIEGRSILMLFTAALWLLAVTLLFSQRHISKLGSQRSIDAEA